METLFKKLCSEEENRNGKLTDVLHEKLNFGVWIWYTVEDRMLFSERFCRMMGISKDVYPTFNLLIEIIYADDFLLFQESIEKILDDSKPRCVKFRVTQPDKSVKEILCYMEAMTAEYVDILDITGVCFDVTG
jgi:hypothetical protein